MGRRVVVSTCPDCGARGSATERLRKYVDYRISGFIIKDGERHGLSWDDSEDGENDDDWSPEYYCNQCYSSVADVWDFYFDGVVTPGAANDDPAVHL